MFDWLHWSGLFARINVAVLSGAAAFSAFDARLFVIRLGTSVPPDALVNYYWILDWWHNGDSPTGFTLTPSPYFIDILLQIPITLLAPDYEGFAYALAATYAVLIFAALFLVVRIALAVTSTFAIAVTGAVVAVFYAWAPFNFIMQAFVVNHTSEVFTTLGLIALVHTWFRRDTRLRRYRPYTYALIVALCVASSPFFIATYCIPAALAAVALLGTTEVNPRRLLLLWGLTVVGAVLGLVSLALVSRYAWPVRRDLYQGWWKSYLAFKAAIAD